MFNADGSEAQMCGNGIRCVAKYVHDHLNDRIDTNESFAVKGIGTFDCAVNIETLRGVMRLGINTDQHKLAQKVCVNMGQPVLNGPDIPVNINRDQITEEQIEIAANTLTMSCVSMGNPHAVFFCDHVWDIDLERVGPLIENHELFPERVNVHFVKIDAPDEFTMRTWERGSGITMACGTGACGCAVAGVLTGRTQRKTIAHLPGGDLELFWNQEDNCVYMTGPAVEVFTGIW
jgi:diaminopimelate epimerase